MIAIAHNPLGLQVRDLIAQLQAQPPNDYTNISELKREPGCVIGAVQLMDHTHALTAELDEAYKRASAQASAAESRLRTSKAEHAALFKRADSARIIQRRIKQLKQQRPLSLP